MAPSLTENERRHPGAGSRAVSSEITYFVSYACPSCRTHLEARHTGWDGWLRCPVCKWPSLPPEVMLDRREARRRAALLQNNDDDVLVISELPESALEPSSRPSADVGRSAHSSPARLILIIGFAFSLFLVLSAYLDDRWGNLVIFAILAIGFFFLLVRAPRNRASS
jgi:hypothetical protein